MAKIFSIRKGSVQWNEEDRLQLAMLLVKCGYQVRLGRKTDEKGKAVQYYVEYSEPEGGENE